MSAISTLPEEILLRINSYLQEEELTTMMVVSKQFYAVANDPILWSNIAHKRKIVLNPSELLQSKKKVIDSVKRYNNLLFSTVQMFDDFPIKFGISPNIFVAENYIQMKLQLLKQNHPKIAARLLKNQLVKKENLYSIENVKILVKNGALLDREIFSKRATLPDEIFKYLFKNIVKREIYKIKEELKNDPYSDVIIEKIKDSFKIRFEDYFCVNLLNHNLRILEEKEKYHETYLKACQLLHDMCLNLGVTLLEEVD